MSGKLRSHFYQGEGPIPDSVLKEHLEKSSIGKYAWIYYGTTYGPSDIRKYKLDIVYKEFTKVPGVKRIPPETLPDDHYFWSRARIAAGEPDLEELAYMNWVPNGAHVGISPVSPTKGEDALSLMRIAKERHQQYGVDLFLAFCVGLRELHMITLLIYDRGSQDRRKNVEECMRNMIDDAAINTYGEYRTHLVF